MCEVLCQGAKTLLAPGHLGFLFQTLNAWRRRMCKKRSQDAQNAVPWVPWVPWFCRYLNGLRPRINLGVRFRGFPVAKINACMLFQGQKWGSCSCQVWGYTQETGRILHSPSVMLWNCSDGSPTQKLCFCFLLPFAWFDPFFVLLHGCFLCTHRCSHVASICFLNLYLGKCERGPSEDHPVCQAHSRWMVMDYPLSYAQLGGPDEMLCPVLLWLLSLQLSLVVCMCRVVMNCVDVYIFMIM